MMNCPHCGLKIDETSASFCPHCGQQLDTFSTNLPPERRTRPTLPPPERGTRPTLLPPEGNIFPSQPIHQAPTRISAGSFPPDGRGWASDYGQPPGPPDAPATNPAFYGPAYPADQPPGPPVRRPAPSLPPPAPRRAKGGRVVLSVLVLLIVFASGVGVGILVTKPQSQQAPNASKTTASTPKPSPTAPSPTATPVEHVIFADPLTAPVHPWLVDASHCLFKSRSYHVLADFICQAPIGIQSDTAISVQVKQVAGTDRAFYGISLRYAGAGNFYIFMITSNSTWTFVKVVHNASHAIIAETVSAAIKPGLNTSNTLLVRVKGAHFDFFINGTSVGEADDTTLSAGLAGLIGAVNTDVAFNNFQVATLT